MAAELKLSVSKRHILCSEILAVTSIMRKNSRWASSSQSALYSTRDDSLAASLGLRRAGGSSEQSVTTARREVQLMSGFIELNRLVKGADDLESVSLLTLLNPFFDIIRSPLSTGPITSAALSSLQKLFVSGFITLDSPNLEAALSELSNAVSHCKFEASDASGDEVVLFRIMAVIKECMCGPFSDKLGDVEVCEMLETVLTTCCQMRLSEILRRFAESTMDAIVRRIFRRICTLDPAEEEKKLSISDVDASGDELKMTVQPVPQSLTNESNKDDNPADHRDANILNIPEDSIPRSPSSSTMIRTDYGLPSVIELMRVLINILDPNDRMHTDSTRLASLRILNTIFEVAGVQIGAYPSLMGLIHDHGCKYLFQLARSENQAILQTSLRAISTMFETMRPHLKLQQELFLAFTIDRLAPGALTKSQVAAMASQSGLVASPRPGTPVIDAQDYAAGASEDVDGENTPRSRAPVAPAKGETRDFMLETLVHIARHPSFMVDLYSNYDCDSNCEDLFERLIDFLVKGVYSLPSSSSFDGKLQGSQLLCLEVLLDFIAHMTERSAGVTERWPSDFPDPDELLQSKSRKRLVLTGASRFNTKPKVGLSFLEENKLIYSDLSEDVDRPKSLARFLKSCTRLEKRLLGDFISRPENIEVLRAFIALFDFKNKTIDEALRELLASFRLPGEAQQIARILEEFAAAYFSIKPPILKSQDATYVLIYSIILLNTDLYNPQNRKKMTVHDYHRNVRGVNDGEDFPTEFINAIYESIRKSEIVMPQEHSGLLGFEYAWKELLLRTRASGSFRSCNTPAFDVAMFKSVWKAVMTSIAYAFTTFDDDYTVQRAIKGYRQCATLAGQFYLPEVFDYVVTSLSQVTGLVPDALMTRVPHFPVVEVEDQSVTVSSLSVKFGTNLKGQLAAVVLFTIINGNGDAVREGWTQIFEIYETLFLHSLFPAKLKEMEDFLASVPLHGKVRPRPSGRSDGGLLSTLSSYLLTPYNSNAEAIPEANESEVESTLCAIDGISACQLDQLYSQITTLEKDALLAAVRSLEALAHERTVARLKQEADEPLTPNSPNPRRPIAHAEVLSYDPASVYLLETMVRIASRVPQHIEDVWPIVFEHLSALLSSSESYSSILIERAVAGLWRLCLTIADKPSLRDQLYLALDLLGSLTPSVINNVGEQVILGLVALVKSHRDVIRSQTEWGIVFVLMRSTMKQPAALRITFDLLESLTAVAVTFDNFAGLVTLLDEFGVAAGLAVEDAGQVNRRKDVESPLEAAVNRGRQSVETLFELRKYISQLLSEGTVSQDQVWRQCSLPLLSALGRQSTNASREVRHLAFLNLQRLLLGQQIVVNEGSYSRSEIIFNRILFPLVDELLKPQVFARDPKGMPETRLRASALLCKLFMQYELTETAKERDIRILWIQVLDLLDRLMNIDRRDQLREAVPESLKNIILVMNASGILVPPHTEGRNERQTQLWDATHERMERFVPGFLDAIIQPTESARNDPPGEPKAEEAKT